jgi:rSAM/selenodomain-associated transferase 1
MLQVGTLSGIDRYLAYTPSDARAHMASLAPRDFALIAQSGSDLGDRLHHLSAILLEQGHPGVIIIDSDTPTLPPAYLLDGLDRLRSGTTDLVLGPAEDGGYYLIGLKRPCRGLFDDIPWSSAAVLTQTLRRASEQRLGVATLPPWFDVDTPTDLARLRNDMARNGNLMAPNTRAFLFDRRRG